jgi:hypothetical protein
MPQLAREPQTAEYMLQFPARPWEKMARGLKLPPFRLKGALGIAGILMKFMIDSTGLTILDQPSEAPKKFEKA